MKNTERFDLLCARLLSGPTPHLQSSSPDSAFQPDVDFATLCRQAGLSLTEADNLFFSCFGISGEAYLSYQQGKVLKNRIFVDK